MAMDAVIVTMLIFVLQTTLSTNPTSSPSNSPSNSPLNSPSNNPSNVPSNSPIIAPTFGPSNSPTITPTNNPTNTPISVTTHSVYDVTPNGFVWKWDGIEWSLLKYTDSSSSMRMFDNVYIYYNLVGCKLYFIINNNDSIF